MGRETGKRVENNFQLASDDWNVRKDWRTREGTCRSILRPETQSRAVFLGNWLHKVDSDSTVDLTVCIQLLHSNDDCRYSIYKFILRQSRDLRWILKLAIDRFEHGFNFQFSFLPSSEVEKTSDSSIKSIRMSWKWIFCCIYALIEPHHREVIYLLFLIIMTTEIERKREARRTSIFLLLQCIQRWLISSWMQIERHASSKRKIINSKLFSYVEMSLKKVKCKNMKRVTRFPASIN